MHEVDQDVVVMYTLVTIYLFKNFFVYYVHEGSEGLFRVFTFEGACRVFTFEGVCRVFTLRVYVGYIL